MISAVKADDFKAALLKAGLTDEVLAEGEPALDAILNKVGDLSQVQRVRLKQWYRKNMIVKPAAAPKATAEEAKPAAPEVTYTPEEMAAIEAVKKQMRKPQEMLTPISEWLYGKIIQQRKEFDAQQKSIPLAVRAAQNFGERLEVLADRISRHWRDKYRDSEIQTHIASAAFDFHPKESMVWLELYMQRFMGYKRYKAAPGQSIAKVNFYLMIRHLRESRAKRIAARDALAAKLGFENPIQKNFTDEKVAQYHASGVEALSFIRGEFDGNRADLVRVHRWLSLWLFAVFLLVAAVLVCAMGDRLSGRKNGVLGLIRAYRIGAISAIRKAPDVLDGAKKRAEPVLGLRVEAPRSWKSLV